MYHVYLILCTDNSIYTGITTNLERRFQEHAHKEGGKYTRAHPVEKVLYSEQFPTRSEATKRETEIKSWRRGKKMELIKKSAPQTGFGGR
jgi:putative endonuclease